MILQLSVSLLIFSYLDTAQAGTPSIDRCPGTLFRRVASSDATVSVTWEEPDCDANAQSTHSQGFDFGPGVHTVIYWFAGGSMSNPNERCCSFDIVVSGPDFDLCSQNSCLSGEVCVPEIDHYYCYPGNTNIKIRNCSSRVITRSTEADSVTAEWVEPTAFDHFYGQLLQPSNVPQISPGSSLSLGEHDVTYTFSDRGKTATCSFQIRVAQNTGPGFQNCPQDITVISTELMVRVEWLEPLLQPNEDSTRITVSQSHSPGQLFPVPFDEMVSYTFTNSESGLSNTCAFQVVTETMDTVTLWQLNRFVRIPQSSQNSEAWPRQGYFRSGNTRNIPLVIIPSRVQPEVSPTNTHMYGKGFYPVTYNVTDVDGNLIGTSKFIVTYYSGQDSALTLHGQCSGRINIPSEIPRAVFWNIPYLDGTETGLIWTDEPDVRPNEDLLPVGDTMLEYLFYSPGSPTPIACHFTVSITDRTSPRIINCPDPIVKTAPRGTDLLVYFPVSLDAIDGPDASVITATPPMPPPVSVPSGQSRTIIYTASDINGNEGQCPLVISVLTEDPPPVVITKCSDHTLVTSEDMTVQLDTSVSPSATGGSGIPDIPATLNQNSFMVNTETIVEATFPSLEGVPFIGDRTCTFNVLVLDDIPPVVNNCTQEVTLKAMKGEDFVRVNWTEPTSVTSLEGGSLVNRTHTPLDPFPVGETTVVWYIFGDEAGFQTFCSINITIEKVSFEPCDTQPIEPGNGNNGEFFSFTFESIVVIVVTAVATFVFSLAIFLLSLCCCTCCCVVDTAKTNTSNDSPTDDNQRTRLFVKIGGKNIPIYGPVTPLSTNTDARGGRQIDDDEFDYDTSQPTSSRAYQNEAPKLPSVSESVFSDTSSNVATGNNYIEQNGGREHDPYGYDPAIRDSGFPPPRPPKPGKQENASKMMRKKTFLEMQAAVQNIREEQAWKLEGRVVDDREVYGFDQPAN